MLLMNYCLSKEERGTGSVYLWVQGETPKSGIHLSSSSD